jgi:hypothetical protein
MFRAFSHHHQELNDCSDSLWFYLRVVVTVVLCLWSGRPARPRTQHACHHDTKVKPEAATAVNELLMMCEKTPETCWDVNKRKGNKLKNCCIWLVIYLNFWSYLAQFFVKWKMFQTYAVEKNQSTYFVCNNLFFFENLVVYEIMWKNVERGRPQMTMARAHLMLDA